MTYANNFSTAISALVTEIDNNGGASVWSTVRDLETQPLALNTRTTGYSVGNNRYSNVITQWHALTPQQKEDQLMIAVLDLSIRYELTVGFYPCIGVWLDTNDNRLYVDPITHVENLAEAMNLGASNGELAIWDISLSREIRLSISR